MGAHCFECVKAAAPSRREQARVRNALGRSRPTATLALIAANVVVFLLTTDLGRPGTTIRNSVVFDGATWGPPVAENQELYRLVTGGFLHFDLRHVGMNMLLLFLLGRRLEQLLGSAWFAGLYAVSLLGGAAGALLVAPDAQTAGASGAVYGVMGGLYLVEKMSGGDPWNDGIGTLVILNVVISFLVPNISIGGHLGGLVAGAAAGYLLGDQRRPIQPTRAVSGLIALAALMVGVALYGASTWQQPLF